MEEFAAIPDSVVDEMLNAAGTVVVRHHQAKIRAPRPGENREAGRQH